MNNHKFKKADEIVLICFFLLAKLEFRAFLNYQFFRDFQTMPILSMCRKGIENIFRNVPDFFANYIYINHIRPKKLCL